MSGQQTVTFTLELGGRDHDQRTLLSPMHVELADASIPRLARLLALAIRLEGLIRDETIRDYAAAARLGRVTRARMTQIMKLLDLAPDIQEAILFLPSAHGLNERKLRPVVAQIDWDDQRRMFQELTCAARRTAGLA